MNHSCTHTPLSILTAISPDGPGLAGTNHNVSILDFIGAKDDGCGCDSYSYKTCKVLLNHQHQQTNIQFLPFLPCPTNNPRPLPHHSQALGKQRMEYE